MVCIFHSRDADGFSSGALVKLKYPDAKLIGYDYGEQLPYDEIPAGEPIIMIDVSLPMPEMLKLADHSGWQLTWVDHHRSAIKDYKEFVGDGETFCTAVLEDGIAACEGGWKYLFPDQEIPRAIKLLSDYDVWHNQDKDRWENEILPFQFGMKVLCNSPETFPVTCLTDDAFVNKIIEDGVLILKYQAQVNEFLCRRTAFEFEFEGLRAICLNSGGFNSDLFKSVYDESKHDIMMPFQFNGKQWLFSLYSTKPEIDCSVIAKSRKGGGHKGASGFLCSNLEEVFGNLILGK